MTISNVSEALAPPSVGVLVDNARTVVVACRDAGVEPEGLVISERDYAEVARTKGVEQRHGIALRLFGVDLYPGSGLDDGEVTLRLSEHPR